MAKKKSNSARKGKKAWRKISSEDIEDFNEKASKDALSGGPLDSLPSDSIFFLDKSTESVGVPPKRKIEKKREKVLRVDSILQKNAYVQPVPSSTLKKKKKKKADKQVIEVDAAVNASGDDLKANVNADTKDASLTDIWANEDEGATKAKKKVKPSPIPAVEVEPPGCSFNPDPESHKDTLATAVANEMRKIYQNELGPKPIPLVTVREVIDEEQRYYMDADSGEDEEEEVPAEEGDEAATGTRSVTKRVTRVKLNRRARRKEVLKAEAAAKKKEQLSKEIDGISDIMQEIAQEEEEKKKRHIRRVVAKQERLKSCPPRLGKRKFEPAPVQVLLSEEISGSLRKLQGCCTLARDRFKSLEKRGLVVPSAKSRKL